MCKFNLSYYCFEQICTSRSQRSCHLIHITFSKHHFAPPLTSGFIVGSTRETKLHFDGRRVFDTKHSTSRVWRRAAKPWSSLNQSHLHSDKYFEPLSSDSKWAETHPPSLGVNFCAEADSIFLKLNEFIQIRNYIWNKCSRYIIHTCSVRHKYLLWVVDIIC